MIRQMSLSSARCLAMVLVVACGGSGKTVDEPQTAREKQLAEAKKNGELDDNKGKQWGTWRYSGDRGDCFYVVGRKCFKKKKTACDSLACEKKKKKCDVVGGGPATVSCK
jgi:hypothetical protein